MQLCKHLPKLFVDFNQMQVLVTNNVPLGNFITIKGIWILDNIKKPYVKKMFKQLILIHR